MNATELYKAGRLQEAIDAQIQEVKANPADHGRRLFLFELLAFAGDWERARRQIDAVSYGDPTLQTSVITYRKLVEAEDHRRRVFKDGVMPEFLIPVPDWVFQRLEAVKATSVGKHAEAKELLAKSDEAAPVVHALVNGKPAEGLRDCDDLLGPVLEVLAHGGYFWVPFEHIEGLTALPPQFPRDLFWFPVKLSVKNGPSGDAFIPALYPGTGESANDELRLGRATDWTQAEGGPVRGVGLRQLLVGEELLATPDLRGITAAS